jgi:hypothetical protein
MQVSRFLSAATTKSDSARNICVTLARLLDLDWLTGCFGVFDCSPTDGNNKGNNDGNKGNGNKDDANQGNNGGRDESKW